jgi:hypothetical protein
LCNNAERIRREERDTGEGVKAGRDF